MQIDIPVLKLIYMTKKYRTDCLIRSFIYVIFLFSLRGFMTFLVNMRLFEINLIKERIWWDKHSEMVPMANVRNNAFSDIDTLRKWRSVLEIFKKVTAGIVRFQFCFLSLVLGMFITSCGWFLGFQSSSLAILTIMSLISLDTCSFQSHLRCRTDRTISGTFKSQSDYKCYVFGFWVRSRLFSPVFSFILFWLKILFCSYLL